MYLSLNILVFFYYLSNWLVNTAHQQQQDLCPAQALYGMYRDCVSPDQLYTAVKLLRLERVLSREKFQKLVSLDYYSPSAVYPSTPQCTPVPQPLQCTPVPQLPQCTPVPQPPQCTPASTVYPRLTTIPPRIAWLTGATGSYCCPGSKESNKATIPDVEKIKTGTLHLAVANVGLAELHCWPWQWEPLC